MLPSKELWNIPSSSGSPNNGRGTGNGVGGTSSYAFAASVASGMMPLSGGSAGSGVMPSIAPPHDRAQEVCKYFVNGGCLRGASCPYLHELPDERHLDVNGVGFILNPNVHNAQKTVTMPQNALGSPAPGQVSPTSTGSPLMMNLSSQQGGGRGFFSKGGKQHYNALNSTSGLPVQQFKATQQPPARYRPPEPFLEHNLPPVLALPLKISSEETTQALVRSMLMN